MKYYNEIPEVTIETIKNYVLYGYEPGSFICSVFSNDLINSVSNADEENKKNMVLIVTFMYNECPSLCWGNRNRVDQWIKNKGTIGQNIDWEFKE